MKSKSLAIALVGASIVAALVVLMVLQKGRVALFDGPKIEASSTRPVEVDADKADGTPTSPEVDTGMAELPANYRAGANELWDVSPTPLEQLVELGYSLEPDVIADLLLDRTKDPDTRVVAAFSAAQLMDRTGCFRSNRRNFRNGIYAVRKDYPSIEESTRRRSGRIAEIFCSNRAANNWI